jgi:micrococcal nuclease
LNLGVSVVKFVLLVVAALAGYTMAITGTREVSAAPDGAAAPAWFTLRGKVTRVIDGDTLIARTGRGSERVRLIGIDSPEVGTCYAANATAMARTLALNRRVTLQGDRTQSRRDRYGRLLAYVRLPGGRDLGRDLIRAGRARVYVFNRPFGRLVSYRAAEAAAIAGRLGLWGRLRRATDHFDRDDNNDTDDDNDHHDDELKHDNNNPSAVEHDDHHSRELCALLPGRMHSASAARPRLRRHPVPELPCHLHGLRPRPPSLRRRSGRNRLRDLKGRATTASPLSAFAAIEREQRADERLSS